MNTYNRLTCLGVLSTILISGAAELQAQVLEEIVVSAQRRTQSLQEVPIAIEVFSGEEIMDQGYRDLAIWQL